MKKIGFFLAFFIMAITSQQASSMAIYSYVGNNYDEFGDDDPPSGTAFNAGQKITGSMTFSTPLPDMNLGAVTPDSYSFSNGVATFTDQSLLGSESFYVKIVAGQITEW